MTLSREGGRWVPGFGVGSEALKAGAPAAPAGPRAATEPGCSFCWRRPPRADGVEGRHGGGGQPHLLRRLCCLPGRPSASLGQAHPEMKVIGPSSLGCARDHPGKWTLSLQVQARGGPAAWAPGARMAPTCSQLLCWKWACSLPPKGPQGCCVSLRTWAPDHLVHSAAAHSLDLGWEL